MIFVTTGVSSIPFDRLIKKMDEIAATYRAPVFMQTGYNGYKPRNAQHVPILTRKEYLTYMQQADLVVSHAGAGTTMDLILSQKRCILVPRMKKFREHLNDHQLEHIKGWGERLGIKVVYDINELDDLVRQIETIPVPSPRAQTRDELIHAIRQMIVSSVGG